MWKNYLKIAYRNLIRQKGYAFINIFGLAVGLACCLLVLLYVLNELSYDRFHDDLKHLYRVHEVMSETDKEWASTPWAVAEVLRTTYGDRVQVARLRRRGPGHAGKVTVRRDDRMFIEQNLFYADSTIFDVLTFPLLAGNPDRALTHPLDLVLTETMATKYFGEENPIGQTLRLNDVAHTVTGVLEDLPEHSHLRFDILASMPSTWNPTPTDGAPWHFNIYYTYVKVADRDLIPVLRKTLEEQQHQQTDHASTFAFVPVADIYLRSHAERELTTGGDIRVVYLFLVMGVFLLAIACINFVNLATVRSAERAREVGMRKVLGANRSQLARQFMGEAVLLTLIATLLALMLAWAALPLFNGVVGKRPVLRLTQPWWLLLSLAGMVAVGGLLVGSYPAFHLSALQPVRALKGRLLGNRPTLSRHALVVAQFTLSTLLIISTLVVSKQLDFLQRANLGLEKDQILVLSTTDTRKLGDHYTVLKDELKKLPDVRSTTTSDVVPGEHFRLRYFVPEDSPKGDSSFFGLRALVTDEDFVSTYGLEIVEGRNFTGTARHGDQHAYILNEAAVRALGWEAPIGKRVGEGEVIGVVKDFHYASLHHEVEPTIMTNGGGYGAVSIKLDTQNLPRTLSRIEEIWMEVVPYEPFSAYFLDDAFEQLYQREATLRQAANYATALSLLIACLGLFGLTAFTAQRRTKEIGVRKVLGASVTSVALLLSKDFLQLVALVFVVAAPVAYFAMQRWLEGFAYRIDLGPGLFLATGLLVFLIAALTVSYQALRAATADPVKSLRYE